MVGHMRGSGGMSCGVSRFTGGNIGGLPRSSMCCNSHRAGDADANLTCRPRASRRYRLPWPVIKGIVRFEQRKHVFRAVCRPQGKQPVTIQIERASPVDSLVANVSHGRSLRSGKR